MQTGGAMRRLFALCATHPGRRLRDFYAPGVTFEPPLTRKRLTLRIADARRRAGRAPAALGILKAPHGTT
jgi:hypothetical protein